MNRWSTGKPFCVIHAMVDTVFKTHRIGTSLVVQWLRFYIMTAKGQGSISGQGNLIPHVVTKTLCNQIYIYKHTHTMCRDFLVAQKVRSPPAMQETWVQSLGQEDPLEKEVATHSSILAWEIPWTEEPDTLQSMGLQKSQTGLSN